LIIYETQRAYFQVWTAIYCSKPYTIEKLKSSAFSIVDEDWQLETPWYFADQVTLG
jgi:hypothetical protein